MLQASATGTNGARALRLSAVVAIAIVVGSITFAVDLPSPIAATGLTAQAAIDRAQFDSSPPFVYFPSQFPAPQEEPAAAISTF